MQYVGGLFHLAWAAMNYGKLATLPKGATQNLLYLHGDLLTCLYVSILMSDQLQYKCPST